MGNMKMKLQILLLHPDNIYKVRMSLYKYSVERNWKVGTIMPFGFLTFIVKVYIIHI